MRMLLVSQTGYSNGVASFLTSEGHSVIFQTGEYLTISDLPKPDVAIFDSASHYPSAEGVRASGVKVIGPTSWTNLISSDISYKKAILNAVGYKIAEANLPGTGAQVIGWFNGQRFISKFVAFNYDRMMSGNVGAKISSAGYVAHFGSDNSPLVKQILNPLERFLRKANHRGCVTVDVICNEKGVFVKDFNPDFSTPASQAIYENTRRSKSDFLLDLFNESSAYINHIEPYVCGVLVSVYPYPFTTPPSAPVHGLNNLNIRHMWLMDAFEHDKIWTCGSLSGCLGYVVARGKDLYEAKRRAYRTISGLNIDNIQYRNDIGKDVDDIVFKLHKEYKLL
jgi:phosphoribosylamine-glycine ligase